jgi:hypothetical protein
VKTCRSCGLPAPRSTLRCAYCSIAFTPALPAVYRVAPGAAGYQWLRHESVLVLEGRQSVGMWRLCRPGSEEAVLTLQAIEGPGGASPTLIDGHGDVVAALTQPSGDAGALALVHDGGSRLVAVARGDGPSGIHLVDPRGEVTALASRAGTGARVALDVLVTRPSGDAGEAMLFGILLALELTRLGELRGVL